MKDKKAASSEQAMQRVLQAERDAERAIQDCEQQARQTIADAQINAQRIYARTDQRITNMEMRHSHKIDHTIKIIEREGAAALRQEAGQHYDPQQLQSVIDALAIELCLGSTAEDDTGADQ